MELTGDGHSDEEFLRDEECFDVTFFKNLQSKNVLFAKAAKYIFL